MSRKSSRIEKNKINRIHKNRKRNFVIVMIIAICLIIMYKFNFLTKSESTIPLTSVKFNEYGSENSVLQDLELYEEDGLYYVILPEKVNGIYAKKYYKIDEMQVTEENTTIENTEENNIEEKNENQVSNDIVNETTNEAANDNNTEVNNIVENEIADSLFDEVIQTNSEPVEEEDIENTNTVETEDREEITNSVSEQNQVEENTIVENIIENTIVENVVENNVQNTVVENVTKNEISVIENTSVEQEIVENTVVDDDGLISKEEKQNIEEIEESFSGYLPGEKIYLDKDVVKNDFVTIVVEYDTVEINNVKLYKQELITSDDVAEIKVTGYIPLQHYVEAIKEDTEIYEELKSDVDGLSDSEVLLAYDIHITDGNVEYQPKDYYQAVNVSITAKDTEQTKFSESLVQVLHIVEDESSNQIIFEKIALTSKSDDTVEVLTDEFSTYIVTALSSKVGEDQVYIYDYDSDKNYFTGKSNSDSFTGETAKTYDSSNLAQVIINYYGYDYQYRDNDKEEDGVILYYNPKIESQVSEMTEINGTDRYLAAYNLSFTSDTQITSTIPWDIYFSSTGTINVNETQNYSTMFDSITTANGTITLSSDTFSGWTETSSNGKYTYSATVYLVFNATIDDIETFTISIHKPILIGHTSNTERQDLYTYNKCVYAPNGQIKIELIDNPYMDRPAGYGFNGWITNEGSKYKIDTNSYTYEQTLTVSLSDIKDESGLYVVNLYADWAVANVVFLDSNAGNDNYSGTEIDRPVRSWNTASTRLQNNRKTTTTASNRELNILVLKNGTFSTRNISLGDVGTAYTITSLYDGTLYTANAGITVNRDVTLSYDLQIDFLKINTTTNYARNDGTSNLSNCIYGNTYNLRIGRGIASTNTNYTTFVQIQGGPNGKTNSLYKMVIENGTYNNIQIGRANNRTNYTSCGILVLGSDIDRINGTNTAVKSYYRVSSRTSSQTVSGYEGGIRYLGNEIKPTNGINYFMIVKSGSFGKDYFDSNVGDTNSAYSGIYLGGHGSTGRDNSDRYIVVEGGRIANIIGGLQTSNGTSTKTCIYVKNGNVDNIVGGAGVTQTYGDRLVQVTGGTITYSVSGGSNGYAATATGTSGNNGRLVGNTFVYIGGTAIIGNTAITNTLYNVNAGCVLGAGNGRANYNNSGTVTTSHVIIDGTATVKNNVYGAGNYGTVSNDDVVEIFGGTVTNEVFGGGNRKGIGGSSTINMMSGTVLGSIYGGSNLEGTISKNTKVNITGGTIGTNAEDGDAVFGGGKGEDTVISGTSTLNILDTNENVIINGNVYGGSKLGTVTGNTQVTVEDKLSADNSITINYNSNENSASDTTGKIFGGGKGNSGTAAVNSGNVLVTVDGGSYPNVKVFGACNVNGRISGTVQVKTGENVQTNIYEVYGGGNKAIVTNDTDSVSVNIYSNSTINNAFNGGNEAGIAASTTTRAINVIGATITDSVYGGSNTSGTLTETHVNCSTNATIKNVYGGGYGTNAVITGNTDVNIDDCNVENVYGGGNAGAVQGLTDVAINRTTISDSIYGGGNEGAVNNTSASSTTVYVNDSTSNFVYGGGKGQNAVVAGTTNVQILKTNGTSTITDSVFGGGNAGAVRGGAVVNIADTEVTKAVYGGGNQGAIGTTTNVSINRSNILDFVYGGGNQGSVGDSTTVTIMNSAITNYAYGGGNAGEVTNNTSVALDTSTTNEVYGGGNQGAVGGTTTVSIIDSNITDSVYGGGNEGEVSGNTSVSVSNPNIDSNSESNPQVTNNIFGGGKSANVNGTTVTLSANAITKNVYGGGDQGEVTESTNIKISNSSISNNVYGGGNGADNVGNDGKIPGKIGANTNTTISQSTVTNVFGGGKGITAAVLGDTNVNLEEGAKISEDVYGGGDNGYVSGSTYVAFSSPTITRDAYAAGNGEKAVVYGDSHVYSEGTTTIGNNLYGGGNAAETGTNGTNDAVATVDIAGLSIRGNVYGGANSSQINGSTIINIGNEAIDTYYGEEKGYEQGIIQIDGTVYGGGQSMVIDSDKWIDTAISVTDKIYINVYGDGYDTDATNSMNIDGSIFGSGNASNAAQDGFLEIRNYGTDKSRKKLESIQRCSISRIDNSVLMIAGVKDSTSDFKETPFSFNKIGELKLQNNSILYLRSGMNRVSKYESLDADGTTYATVTINDDYTVDASSDNRIYMANGVNLNICYGDPQKLEVSPVKGMTFFGIYKSGNEDTDPDSIYKGIYDQSYVTGGEITDWNSREYLRTYAYGEHTRTPEQDIEKDGFYTNFEALAEGYSYENLSADNYKATSYTAVIEPTPRGEYTYYYWYAGPDQTTYIYDIELIASKFSTLGSLELAFSDMNFPNATLTMSGIDTSGLDSDVELVNKNEIENINTTDDPNKVFGLSMKTGNSGWSSAGTTDFYMTEYDGTLRYQFENAETTPSLSFFLYHSNNITENNNLGTYKITMNLTYWKDRLNQSTALVIINASIMTRVYEGVGYNTAIRPGAQYDLFAGILTNITTKSTFSAYFEMGEQGFFDSLEKVINDTGLEVPDDYYKNSYRVISSGKYVFPENTTITMIDRQDKNDPKYYYYIVSKEDEENEKREFKLDEFLVMGSTNESYSEEKMRELYYHSDIDYQYENFIFIVNFESANFDEYAENAKITPDQNYFEMYLRVDVTINGEEATIDLAKIINDQLETTGYNIYKTGSAIGIKASLSKSKIYLGNDVDLNVTTTYNATNDGATVYDTRYFDKKLGVKLTFYYVELDGSLTQVNGGAILGTEFGLNKNYYYPRADGTTRIKLAELVSNSSSAIAMITKNSTLKTSDYKIKVESFGSPDGIYYGSESSAYDIVDMSIVNDLYGLKSTLDSKGQAIIEGKTGRTLDDEGYVSKDENDNKLNCNLIYQSGVKTPYITVSLYRRNYDSKDSTDPNVYANTYTQVDLQDYVTNELVKPEQILSSYDENDAEESEFIAALQQFEYEYEAVDTSTIQTKVNEATKDTEDLVSVTFDNLDYELKEGLKTGTYKLVFKLYDVNNATASRNVEDDEGLIIDVIEYNLKEYQEIGETFTYLVIK